jgi:hypothetical protein
VFVPGELLGSGLCELGGKVLVFSGENVDREAAGPPAAGATCSKFVRG